MKKIIVALFSLSLCYLTNAQNFTGGFNFVFPYNDSSTSSFLPRFNTSPIGASDTVYAMGKNFMVNNKPFRFWGVNMVAAGAFPEKSEASGIAAHAAKMGINLVRFHHLDNPNWFENGSLFENGQSTRSLKSSVLDKLDYCIFQLRQHGIYTNLNLNVSRTFNALDGVPGADSLKEFGKGVTIFDPQLVLLQKEYAAQLLGHVNPYTGIKLSEDPSLAMVEIINENSLYGMWKDNALQPQSFQGGSLTWRHSRMLDSMWNVFLNKKYQTQQALQNAWVPGNNTGTELILDGGFEGASLHPNWQNEQHNGASATFVPDASTAHSGNKSVRINITSSTGTNWHLQLKHVGFSLKKDTTYKLVFWAKSTVNTNIPFGLMVNGAPYTWFGGSLANLTNNWQQFTVSVTPTEDVVSNSRLAFQLGASSGTIWIDDVSVKQPEIMGLLPGENLANSNIQRNLYSQRAEFAKQRIADLAEFYINLQKSFLEDFRNYLRTVLGVRAPITGNNAFTGIQEGYQNENLDYYDDHAYWDHPNFPGASWDPSNWTIHNTPMVKNNGFEAIASAFSGIALYNKPFTLSEYNHAAPNRYRVEMVPAIASYGSFQGMDGLMFFDYNTEGPSSWAKDATTNFFSIHRDHSVMSLFPAAAYAYRNHLITEGSPYIINYSEADIFNSFQKDNTSRWGKFTPYDKRIQLSQVLITGNYHSSSSFTDLTLPPPQNIIYTTSTSETVLNTTDGLLTTITPKYVSLAGFLQTGVNKATGPVSILSANNFGAITWVSLNNKSLAASDSSFIAISSMQQNTNMVWSNGNTTLGNQWGSQPTSQYPLQVQLRFNIPGHCMLVHTLDNRGQRVNTRSIYAAVPNQFDVSFDQSSTQSLWYAIEVLAANTTEWTGTVSNDWFNAANWCCGNIPTSNSRVVINNGKPNYPMVNTDISVYSLQVNKGAQIFVAPGARLHTLGN